MKSRNGILVACAVLALGVFCPVVQVPIAGSINYFANGAGDGTLLLLLALSVALLAVRGSLTSITAPAALALGISLFDLCHLLWLVHSLKARMAAEMNGNPFGGLAIMMLDTIQVSWGWVLLLGAAAVLLFLSIANSRSESELQAATSEQSPSRQKGQDLRSVIIIGSCIVLFGFVAIQLFGHNRAAEVLDAMNSHQTRGLKGNFESDTLPMRTTHKDFSKVGINVYGVRGFMGNGTLKCLDYKCPTVQGQIRNDSKDTFGRVEVTASFRDSNGKVIFEDTFTPVSSGMFSSNNMPLKPGFIRNFGWVVPDCPSECVANTVTVRVSDVGPVTD